MNDKIVIQLQADALNEDVGIETLLRKAYLIAKKLNQKDFLEWIENEQNGYSDNVPKYRIISGDLKAWNPYRGWIPVVSNASIMDALSTMPLTNAISVVADSYETFGDSICCGISGEITEFLNNNSDGQPTKYTFMTSKMEMKRIMSAVRNKILDWSIILEENGIVGDNLMFNEKEISVAQTTPTIINYTNNFYSSVNNSQIQQGGSENVIYDEV